MRAKELLNSIRVGSGWIGGNQCVDEVQKFFRGSGWEGVD